MAHPCRHHHCCYNVLHLERRRMMRCLMDETDESRFQSDSRVRHDMLMTTYFRNGMCWVLKYEYGTIHSHHIQTNHGWCHPDLPSIICHGQKARRGRKTTATNENPSQFCERHGMSCDIGIAVYVVHSTANPSKERKKIRRVTHLSQHNSSSFFLPLFFFVFWIFV